MLTSELPEPHAVLSGTSTTPASVLSSTSLSSQEDILMFRIGLRLLGEQKKERFLAFMATLKEKRCTNGI